MSCCAFFIDRYLGNILGMVAIFLTQYTHNVDIVWLHPFLLNHFSSLPTPSGDSTLKLVRRWRSKFMLFTLQGRCCFYRTELKDYFVVEGKSLIRVVVTLMLSLKCRVFCSLFRCLFCALLQYFALPSDKKNEDEDYLQDIEANLSPLIHYLSKKPFLAQVEVACVSSNEVAWLWISPASECDTRVAV